MRWPFAKKADKEHESSEIDAKQLMERMLRRDSSREVFRMLYARLIEMRIPTIQLTSVEPFGLHFKSTDGTDYTLYLENLLIQCRDDPDAGIATIERYLTNVENLNRDDLLRAEKIVPQIKDQEFVEMLGTDPRTTFPLDHFAGDLWITYWVDVGHSLRTVSFSDLEKINVPLDQLHDLALTNLRRLLPEVEQHGDGLWFLLTAGGDFTASLLLLPEIWESFAIEVDGDLIASAPTRDVVLVTGSQSKEGLAAVRNQAARLVQMGDHIVSNTLLRRLDGEWKVYN